MLIFLWLLVNFAKIKNVYCYCDGQVCEEDLCQQAKKTIGKNLITLNKKNLSKELALGRKYQKIDLKNKGLDTLIVEFHSAVDFLVFNSTVMPNKPTLSINSSPVASDSTVFFNKPSVEIADWLKNSQLVSFKIYPDGFFEATSTTSSQIFTATLEKKDFSWYKSAYDLIKIVLSHADISNVYFLDNNVYFAQVGQPDIIINMEYDEQRLIKSLQSLRFITTIKKDPKIIDLRYANPIIR